MSALFYWQLLALLLLVVGVLLYRFSVIPFTIFSALFAGTILIWFVLALISLGAFLFALANGSGLALARYGSATVVGLLLLIWLGSVVMKSRSVPRIHDITTDTINPPAFVQAATQRRPTDNSAEYNRAIAQQQLEAYPDVQPLVLNASIEQLFPQALQVAQEMGWDVHYQNPETGMIEAKTVSRLFGFVDDIVIRVSAQGEEGARVDVRSASRVGVSDLGANAQRIRQYLKQLQILVD